MRNSSQGIISLGDELQVNTTTAGPQQSPAMARLSDGGSVILWQSRASSAEPWAIFGQRLDRDGVPVGPEFRVSDAAPGAQRAPAIAASGEGFVAVWLAQAADGASGQILARAFDDTMTALGPAVAVNEGSAFVRDMPRLVSLADGAVAVVWQSFGQDGSGWGVQARVLEATLTPIGPERAVNARTDGAQRAPDVIATADGGYAVSWSSEEADLGSTGVFVQRFGSDGTPQGSNTRLSSAVEPVQTRPAMATLPDGSSLAVWESQPAGQSQRLAARRFDEIGTPIGDEFALAPDFAGAMQAPQIVPLAAGSHIVLWQSPLSARNTNVFGQLYGADGREIGPPARINSFTDSQQLAPVAVPLADDQMLVAWQSLGNDGDDYGVFAQLLRPNSPPVGEVQITGRFLEGEALQADASALADPDGLGTFAYQWFRDGVALPEATEASYVLTNADIGSRIAVQVQYVDGAGVTESVLSADGDLVQPLPRSGELRMLGELTPGQFLLLEWGDRFEDVPLADVSYRWFVDGVLLPEATERHLLLTDYHAGREIAAKMFFRDTLGNSDMLATPVSTPVRATETTTFLRTETIGAFEGSFEGVAIEAIVKLGNGGFHLYSQDEARTYVSAYSATGELITPAQFIGEGFIVHDYKPSGESGSLILFAMGPVRLDRVENTLGSIGSYDIRDQFLGRVQLSHQEVSFSYNAMRYDYVDILDPFFFGTGFGTRGKVYEIGDGSFLLIQEGRDYRLIREEGGFFRIDESHQLPGVSAGFFLFDQFFQLTDKASFINPHFTGEAVVAALDNSVVRIDYRYSTLHSFFIDADELKFLSRFDLDLTRLDATLRELVSPLPRATGEFDPDTRLIRETFAEIDATGQPVLRAHIHQLNAPPEGDIRILGSFAPGQTLLADLSDLRDPDGLGPISLQWLRDGQPIAGATSDSYTLTRLDSDARIELRAQYTDGLGHRETVFSAAFHEPRIPPSPIVEIHADVSRGLLTAFSSTIPDFLGVGFSTLQWLRDGAVIEGATGRVLELDDTADEGVYTVELSFPTVLFGEMARVTSGPASLLSADTESQRPGATLGLELQVGDRRTLLLGERGKADLSGGSGDDWLFGDGVLPVHDMDAALAVYRLYQATLNRTPDVNGHSSWTEQLAAGTQDLITIAAAFVGSREFQNTYGDLANARFVSLLYRNVLGREADPSGLDGWVDALEGGASRAQVVVGFSESREFQRATEFAATEFTLTRGPALWQGDVFRLYQATLGRDPDVAGFKGWATLLADGTPFLTAVTGFVDSREFQNTYGALDNAAFVTLLYQNVLARAPDAAGLDGWVSQLDSDVTRAEVVRGFAQSAEFIRDTAPALRDWIRTQGVDDVLDGGAGTNDIWGGMLADVFRFHRADAGTHRVHDLEPWDYLDFIGFGYASADDVRAQMTQQGADVVFEDQGTTVVLLNTQLAALEADAFIFA